MKSLLLFVLLFYCYADHASAFDESKVVFCIFENNPRNVSYLDFMVLPQTGFDADLPTVFVIHGYLSGYTLLDKFQRAWQHLSPKMNLIGIDWSKGSTDFNYNQAVRNIPTAGSAVGRFIMDAIRNRLITNPYSIHIIGHSLGAHVAGFVGKYMASSGPNPQILRHISALDPAGPTIGSYECSRRLCYTDASFVETFYTNGGTLGMYNPIESLDLYMNGGKSQPHCILPTCSHSYAHELYRLALDRFRLDGWLCNDIKQMENEKFCMNNGNPRKYSVEIIQRGSANFGIVYVPTTTLRDNGDNATSTRKKIRTNQAGDFTTVVFGANLNNAVVLVSLLSDDGHLIIEKRNDEVVVVNPANAAWTPDPKYHVCGETEPRRIAQRLSELTGPFRFVIAFDATDMFTDPFWEMIYYLADYQKSATDVDEIQMIAMDIPHDGVPLQRHSDELKRAIENGLQPHHAADVRMAGMHAIEETGVVSQMAELQQELVVVKNAVGQYLNRNSVDNTLNQIVKEKLEHK
ncbi:pancreatic lipase-related protein 2-like [Bradysia coprophila]|uniref:pancreatic lipase-related protein 2-like n=1 Tax=Bradysia coprophila TaxID=38358 RepID=UPI00187DB94E|nr:pancreatic lipase-related protein 2-like [Bradysia coprophila]